MKWIISNILVTIAFMGFVSCSDEHALPIENTNALTSEISVVADLDGTKSRGGILDNDIKSRGYGIFIHNHGAKTFTDDDDFEEYSSNTLNMWWDNDSFGYPTSADKYRALYLSLDPKFPNRRADFYAYSPWQESVTDLRNITYDLQQTEIVNDEVVIKQPDLLYASENATTYSNNNLPLTDSQTGNSLICPDGQDKTVTFTFKHALACLEFNFKGNTYDSDWSSALDPWLAVMEIDVHVRNGVKLYRYCDFNAITGEVSNPREECEMFYQNKLSSDGGLNLSGAYKYDRMVLYPVDISSLADDAVVFHCEFQLYGLIVGPIAKNLEFDITKAMLEHYTDDTHTTPVTVDGAEVYGIKAGYIYSFYFHIDNYLHFDGVKVDADWHQAENESLVL